MRGCTRLLRMQEIRGDLFSCSATTSLAHCISEDCRMGKGIAVAFKNKFGGVSELKTQVSQGKKSGKAAVLHRNDRWVYYLITKKLYFHKPTYDSLQSSLQDMKAHALANSVAELAMPRIGCGLDGLEWDRVKEMIEATFKDSGVHISVYFL